jgi:LemA protein
MIEMIYLVGAGIALVLIYSVITYNSFISLNNRVINSWAQVNVQLKKRSDLIPTLVNIVKGYSRYEKKTLTEITKLRASITKSKSIKKKYELNKKISRIVDSFFVIAENYPKLKANENFLQLQEELSDVEDKIAFTRQFYNDVVYKYNNKLQSFPSSIIGRLMKLKKKDSFDEKTSYKGVSF